MKSSEKVKFSQRQNTSIGNDYTLDPTGSRSNNLIHREPCTLEEDYLNPREFVPFKTKPNYRDDTDVDFSLLKENWKDFSSKLRLHRSPEEKPPLPQPRPRVYRRPSLDVPDTGPAASDNRPAAFDTRPDSGPGPVVPERKASIPIPQIYHLPPEGPGLTGWGPGPPSSLSQGYPGMFIHPGQQDPDENVYQEIDPRNMEKQQQQQQQQQHQRMQEIEMQKQQQENDGNEALELQRQKRSFISKYCKLTESVPLDVYQPKCKETLRDDINRVRKVEIGSKKRGKAEKVVIVVGATGSGKTTLINGMFNYVLGVDWKDDYRFKLIQESIKDQSVNQAKSQTSWITAYTIHHKDGFAVPYTLTIIDTPGFGDTSGIKRDQQITEQIRKFFTTKGSSGIDSVDAVGFVSQSSLPRLTPSQKYIFDSVLSLFGKDIAENIFMLLTFADGQKPQVLSGIKEAKMPFKSFYKFNNSALYVKNTKDEDDADDEEEEGNFNEMFWKVGVKSFKNFMTELGKVQPRSLVLTKQVLTERGRLELTLEGIQKDLKVGLNKLEQLSKEVEILKRHQADLDKNKNFTYEVNEETIEVEPTEPGQYTTNCMKCNMTCHEYCSIPDDEDKSGCWAMVNDHCNICAESCHWSMHKNQPYIYIIKSKKVMKTADDLKKRYEEAEGRKMTAEQLIKKCADEFEAVRLKILALTEQARKSIAKLYTIALKPSPLSTVDYIDILINSENTEARPGWKQRVDQLMDVKRQAENMQKIANSGYDPFEEYKKKFSEEKKENKDGVWSTAMKFLNKGFGEDVPVVAGSNTESVHETSTSLVQETDDEGIDCDSDEGDVDDSDDEEELEKERIVEDNTKEEQDHRKKKKKKQKKKRSKRNKDGLFSRGLQFLGLRKKNKNKDCDLQQCT